MKHKLIMMIFVFNLSDVGDFSFNDVSTDMWVI